MFLLDTVVVVEVSRSALLLFFCSSVPRSVSSHFL